MSHTLQLKNYVKKLRNNGESLSVISKKTQLSKSTIFLWTKNIVLSEAQKKNLIGKSKNGLEKALKVLKNKRQVQKVKNTSEAKKLVSFVDIKNKRLLQIIAGIIFWCEGGKRQLSTLRLANSDEKLIKTFLYCLRKGFDIKENRLKALIHLHDYHNEAKQVAFWSKETKIPLSQFNKSYHKKNTKIRQRKNYQGCISLRYMDAGVARKLDAIYHAFAEKIIKEQ